MAPRVIGLAAESVRMFDVVQHGNLQDKRKGKERKGHYVVAWQASGATAGSITSGSTAEQQGCASAREEQQERRSERGSSSGGRCRHDSLLVAGGSQAQSQGKGSRGNNGKELTHDQESEGTAHLCAEQTISDLEKAASRAAPS